ncbi:IclR family transcriptional regulator [Actinomadura nitritigenes]|uniref:IclR family transcriptional regulator n=1 Tax=Actinomadura nitritigenes TaxID=134602 RepID=A0ABS3R8X8_9ACTN|nr:IclR family transcriptional regulator [Actinomadura nitritigenes]MBO2442684.1 IclR family transcriptional regulator [Actinomadura nitritigenes]
MGPDLDMKSSSRSPRPDAGPAPAPDRADDAPARSDAESKNVLSSARRVLQGLQVIAEAREPVTLAALADALGTSEVAAYRVACTLIAEGYVRQAPSRRAGYELTWKIVEMATARLERTELRTVAAERLAALAEHYAESITVAIPDGDHVVFVDKVNANRDVQFYCDIGKRLPLHVGAASRAILAHGPERLSGQYLSRTLTTFTDATPLEPDAIRADLERIRNIGYAVSIGDVEVGISAIAAPIVNARSEILGAAAIANVSAKWSDDDIRDRGEDLKRVCAEISAECAQLDQPFVLAPEAK